MLMRNFETRLESTDDSLGVRNLGEMVNNESVREGTGALERTSAPASSSA